MVPAQLVFCNCANDDANAKVAIRIKIIVFMTDFFVIINYCKIQLNKEEKIKYYYSNRDLRTVLKKVSID